MPQPILIPMAKSINDWLAEGEALYAASLAEMHELESRLEDLEQQLSAKQAEVNRLGQVIGKAIVEQRKVLTGTVVGGENGAVIANSPATIARALTGRGLGK